ncbi:pilus assembly protein PilO [Sutcliffiella sp. NC1]|uniref:pilus assembly protein PilO n=1 Tax=Sutcliffiella sp. NC1 TaxID=3004096 RepID=UPI0022DE251E|nr:pilus assembly protein PilO [Sutcliffiella sp. NC1]WBL13991.1 pilus assembly protein PilO [Sutcliffiella sp. NC1]
MNIELQKIHYIILGSVVAALLLAILLFYYALYSPKQVELNSLQSQLQVEEQLLQVLEEQERNILANLLDSTVELQRKVPVAPFVEQMILELEKAETISGALITNTTFGEEAVTTSTLDEYVQSEELAEELPGIPLPEGLKKLTMNLTVQAETYEDLKAFLSEVENLTRITQIESVTFSGTPEVTSLEQEASTLTFSVSLSAFYHPELQDLIEDLPPIFVPEPSNKSNPFRGS